MKVLADKVEPMWPLDAPGMPPVGPDFLRQAGAFDEDDEAPTKGRKKDQDDWTPSEKLVELYETALRTPGFSLSIETKAGRYEEVTCVPGHIWGQNVDSWAESLADRNVEAKPVDGPHRADVMIIGKNLGGEEVKSRRNLVGPSGEVLTNALNRLHAKDARRWYITNLVKFRPPGTTTLRTTWVKDCLPLLHAELRMVRPKYILCLGADAAKALLGKKYGIGYMEGRVIEYKFPVNYSRDEEPEEHTALVMAVIHPAQVARAPDLLRTFERGIGRFLLLRSGARFDLEEKGLDHRVIDNLEEAEEWVREVDAEFADRPKKDRLIAWDAEWHGQHPINEGAYLRTVQAAWAPKKAVAFKLRGQGGAIAFRDRNGKPAIKRLMRLLQEFVKDKRAVGHFLVSDLEWLAHSGFDPTAGSTVPVYSKDGKSAWERLRDGRGWLDTAMMFHAVEETALLGLENLAMRYTTAPRYDIPLEDWKKEWCKKHDIPSTALEGYGDCPDEILLPYSIYDADVTLRLALEGMKYLDVDYEGNCCWEPFWESMIVQPVLLEMHQNGVLVDRGRIDELTKAFFKARAVQEKKIKDWAAWPEFNVRSVQQVREFLFGEELNGKVSKTGEITRIRPPKGKSLRVEPLLDTAKPPRRWADLKEKQLDKDASPGTGKMILSILAQDNLTVSDQINWIRDYRFLDQVLKGMLRPPVEDESGRWVHDEEGFFEYDAGLASCIDDDGRVRTHFYTTAETGRWRSARPNLQNASKQRDDDYYRLLGSEKVDGKWVGGDYTHPLRSILTAADGYLLVEFDYVGAELFGMAVMSGDEKMIDHAQRATLPDEGYNEKGEKTSGGKYPHPNYYDIHSNVAKLAFRLNCAPTKKGLKDIGKAHFRILAKNVIFGIAYGRQAKAIALQAKEQKVNVTPEDAQRVIDAIFEMYPKLKPFFESAASRALEEKWLCHCFGRFRRFPSAADYQLSGEFERQAMNFPIQGMVASAVNRGLAKMRWTRDHKLKQPDLFKMLLQMHDAGLLEVPYKHVAYVADELIPNVMSKQVPIYPSALDGTPSGKGPYYLGTDITVCRSWGEKLTVEECREFGIPEKFGRSAA